MVSVSLFRPTVVRKTGGGAKGRKRGKTKVWWMAWRCARTGRRMSVSTGARDRSAAKTIARDHERRLALAPYGLATSAKPAPVWEEFIPEYLDCVKSKNRHGTATAYEISLRHFTAGCNPVLISEVTVASLQDFVTKRRGDGVKPATVNKDLRALRSALRWAEERGYGRCPKFRNVFLREEVKAPVVIPRQHALAILQALDRSDLLLRLRPDSWWKVLVHLLHGLGLRRGEALGLLWGAVNFEKREVTVVARTSKTGRERTLPLGNELMLTLEGWRDNGMGDTHPSSPVLPWEKTTTRQLYDEWERIQVAAGLPEGVRYVLKNYRSTCGSELIQAGTPSMVVKDILGHSTVTTTERHYVDTRPSLRAALKRREEFGTAS